MCYQFPGQGGDNNRYVSVKSVFRGRRRLWENLTGQTGSLLQCDGKAWGRTGLREVHHHSFSVMMTELHNDGRSW